MNEKLEFKMNAYMNVLEATIEVNNGTYVLVQPLNGNDELLGTLEDLEGYVLSLYHEKNLVAAEVVHDRVNLYERALWLVGDHLVFRGR